MHPPNAPQPQLLGDHWLRHVDVVRTGDFCDEVDREVTSLSLSLSLLVHILVVARHPGLHYISYYIPAHAGGSDRQRQTLKNDFLSPGPHRPGGVLNFPSFEKVSYPCVVSVLVML